ncbi:MAG: sulfotransferase [Salinivirgaceae bacterium]|jgi:hypothetical protein|nr:sulfotransferase [Salinivirgaceae bacterium]
MILKEPRINILICGVSRSGSQSLVDLFGEYNNIGIYPGEFDDFRAPGMVADQLEEKLRQDWPSLIQKSLQIPSRKSRILQRLYFNPHFQKTKLERFVKSFEPLNRRINSSIKRQRLMNLDRVLQSGASQEEKLRATKDWVQAVGDIYCNGDRKYRYFLFDQPLTLSTNIDVVKKVFEPFKMICSLRDPKDQMANVIKDKYLFLPYGAPRMNWGGDFLQAQYGRTRKGAFKMWVNDINIKYKRTDALEKQLGSDRFKVINFESLVKDYDRTVAGLESFVGLKPENHTNQKKYFNPQVSIKNVGYHAQYLKPEEYELLKDLERMYYERFPIDGSK